MQMSDNQTCPAVGYQAANICVPVTVTPFAVARQTTTRCCGAPIVVPGRTACSGILDSSCTFTMSQNICVAVPVDFGATATVGDAYVSCITASSDNICADCEPDTLQIVSTAAQTIPGK